MILGIVLCCLAALLPAALLYFPNMAEIPFPDMLPYFAVMAGLGVLAWAGMLLITRRKGLAALAAALWLLVLLNVGRLTPILEKPAPALAGFKFLAPASLVILAAATFGLSRLSEDFLRDAVKVAALALAAFILAAAVPAVVRSLQPEETEEAAASAERIDTAPAEGKDRPNIYWIIADEYAGLDELEKYYHYDNSPFYDSLRELGFTVSDHSYNWAVETFHILYDTLNLRYASANTGKKLRESLVTDPDLPLWTLMRDLGYEVCEAESTNKFRLVNRLEKKVEYDPPRTSDGNTVANLLVQYSVFRRYEDRILGAVAPALVKTSERQSVLNVLEWAENPDNMRTDRPTFTVVYMKCPHEPFVFDQDGGTVPRELDGEKHDKSYYLNQLIYISKRLRNACETIVKADPDAIVLLQSDHGHRFVYNSTRLDETNVMNAVYFRGGPLEEIVNKNMLNTWRTVLRKQFGLDLPDVKEKRLKNEYYEFYRDPNEEDPNAGLID